MKNIAAIIIASLAIASINCAKPAKVSMPAVTAKEDAYYGKALGIKVGEDAFKQGKYDLALSALNDGLWFLRKANTAERCGTSRTPCMVYKVYGLYLRAQIHAINGNAEMAIADLNWIHENGYMRILVRYYKFWNEKNFDSIKGNRDFQYLVRTYQR